jgi:hypothetical protein
MSCKKFLSLSLAALCLLCAGGRGESASAAAPPADALSAAREFLADAPLSDAERRAVASGIEPYPNQAEWVLSGNGSVYAIVLRPVPSGSGSRAKLEEFARRAAAIKAKHLLYLRAASGGRKWPYASGDSFAGALAAVDGDSGGQALKLSAASSKTSGGWAFAIAVSPDEYFDELARRIETMDESAVREAYCGLLYADAKKLRGEGLYDDALALYGELRSLEWPNPEAYLEASGCLIETGRRDEALKLTGDALSKFGGVMDSGMLERAGDLLMDMGDEPGAERAYRMALEKIRSEGL